MSIIQDYVSDKSSVLWRRVPERNAEPDRRKLPPTAINKMTLSPEYAAFAADFVAKRDAKIRPEWRLTAEEIDSARNSVTGVLPFVDSKLTPREVEITKWTGEQALKEMHKKEGRTSIVEVVTSVCHRAALTQQIINCFVGWY